MVDSQKSYKKRTPLDGASFLFISSVLVGFIFVLTCIRAPLWYDESNYLSLIAAIRATGYPVWFWQPGEPQLFFSHPPAVLYVLSILPEWFTRNIVCLRLFNIAVFGLGPFFALMIQSRRGGISLFTIYATALFTACTGVFLMELIQVRFDMPLAALSCFIILIYANAIEPSNDAQKNKGPRASFRSPFLLLSLSILIFLTKFQAICLTGALALDVVAEYLLSKKRIVVGPFLTHFAGALLGIVIFLWWLSSSKYAPGSAELYATVHWNIAFRTFPGNDFVKQAILFLSIAQRILALTVVPLTVFLTAWALGTIDWNERLFRLFLEVTIVVILFNLAIYRSPGAAGSNMLMAVVPLGYILGRSFESLLRLRRGPVALWSLVFMIGLHGILNFPPVTRALQPDFNQMGADRIEPLLGKEDLLLLGDENQSRAIPFMLHRNDRYGFLFSMIPADALGLLAREGPGKVGALVLSEDNLAQLQSEKWSSVSEIIDRRFYRADYIGTNYRLVILLPRKSGEQK